MALTTNLKYKLRSRILNAKTRLTGRPREVLQTENFADRLRKKRVDNLTKSLALRFARDFPRVKDNMRGLNQYNFDYENVGLPSINKIIKSFNKPVVKILDACAGFGNVGKDLLREFPNTKESLLKVKYEGIDIVPRGKVKAFDLVSDRLPKNTYDLIIEDFGFPYLTDKFKALENLCNSLKVGGILMIPTFGIFEIDGKSNMFPLPFSETYRLFFKSNPHLLIRTTTNGGLMITKRVDQNTRFPLHFLNAKAENPKAYFDTLRKKESDTGLMLTSKYTF